MTEESSPLNFQRHIPLHRREDWYEWFFGLFSFSTWIWTWATYLGVDKGKDLPFFLSGFRVCLSRESDARERKTERSDREDLYTAKRKCFKISTAEFAADDRWHKIHQGNGTKRSSRALFLLVVSILLPHFHGGFISSQFSPRTADKDKSSIQEHQGNKC